jgi:hypothetical protein
MSDFVVVSGDKISFNFHPGQEKAWDSRKRFIAIIAGAQSGKTSFSPVWLWREIQDRGPGDYAVVSPVFTLMEAKVLPEFKTFFCSRLRIAEYTGSPVKRLVMTPEGEEQLFGSAQDLPTQIYFGYAANPDSLESATYKAVVCDEAGQKAFKRESWEAILRRLAINRGRALITTTPYGMGGWLKTDIHDRWKDGDADIDVIRFSSVMNPAFPQAEFDRAARDLPHWKFQLFYMGNFSRPAGLIYDTFDQKAHVRARFKIPDEWPRYVGMDFGATNTAAVFFAAELNEARLPTGRLFAYREYHPGKREPIKHVEAILAGEPMTPTVVGGSPQEDEWRARFGQAGLGILEPPVKDVEVGIDAVYGCFCRNEIVIFDDMVGLIDQLNSYSRELDDQGDPTDAIEEKQLYHLLDACRYLIVWMKRGSLSNWKATRDDSPLVAPAPRGVFLDLPEEDSKDRGRRIGGGSYSDGFPTW